jgi:polysaccharide biosynthesis protein PslH
MKILFLSQRFLLPMDTGGKIRTGKILEQLSKKHDITLISNVESPQDDRFLPEMSRLSSKFLSAPWKETPKYSLLFFIRLIFQMFSIYPVSVLNDTSRGLRKCLETEYASQKYDLVICDFVQSSLNFKNIRNSPSILFQHNVESQIAKRHYDRSDGVIGRLFWWLQWKKTLALEKKSCQQFDTVIAVSEQDRATFCSLYALDNVVTIPTGVDLNYFHPQKISVTPSNLVFVGSMDWLPNEDAILYFVENILPAIKMEIPDISLAVVGRNPSPRLKKRLSDLSEIRLTGWVDDVRPYIAKASIYIVPIRIGGGTRMKIYEAMAMGKAIISTSIGAEGLAIQEGVNIVLEDDPLEFAHKIIKIERDTILKTRLGKNASAYVKAHCSWSQVGEAFLKICIQCRQLDKTIV